MKVVLRVCAIFFLIPICTASAEMKVLYCPMFVELTESSPCMTKMEYENRELLKVPLSKVPRLRDYIDEGWKVLMMEVLHDAYRDVHRITLQR